MSRKRLSTAISSLPAVKEQAKYSWGFLLSITASLLQKWTGVSSPWEKSTPFAAGPEGPAQERGRPRSAVQRRRVSVQLRTHRAQAEGILLLAKAKLCTLTHTHTHPAACPLEAPTGAHSAPTGHGAWPEKRASQPRFPRPGPVRTRAPVHRQLWRCSGDEKGPQRPAGSPRTPLLIPGQPLLSSRVLLHPPCPPGHQLLKAEPPGTSRLFPPLRPPTTVQIVAPAPCPSSSPSAPHC